MAVAFGVTGSQIIRGRWRRLIFGNAEGHLDNWILASKIYRKVGFGLLGLALLCLVAVMVIGNFARR